MRYLITGAAGGIGRATAELICARADHPVTLTLVDRDETALADLSRQLSNPRVTCCALGVDLSDTAAAIDAAAAAIARFGGLDVLISNAGIMEPAPLETLDPASWDRTFAVNVRATYLLAGTAFTALRESRGSVVATASTSARLPTPPGGAYSASKAALVMLVRQLSLEWGRYGVRCNCVSPGPTDTGLTELSFGTRAGPRARAHRQWRESIIPLQAIGRPEQVAEAIVFLAGPGASHITGVDLLVDGGLAQTLMPISAGSPGWLPDRLPSSAGLEAEAAGSPS